MYVMFIIYMYDIIIIYIVCECVYIDNTCTVRIFIFRLYSDIYISTE